jgi:acyl-coenzyme A thioesterase PaaI-like protein
MLAAEVRFDSKFSNPMGVLQGGFLCAMFDEVYGPLTYMATGRPVVTIEMSTSFLRPFTERDEFVFVRAEVLARSRSLIVLKAEARNRSSSWT